MPRRRFISAMTNSLWPTVTYFHDADFRRLRRVDGQAPLHIVVPPPLPQSYFEA